MKIDKNKVVSLIYKLRENNSEGRIIETIEPDKPMTFLFGNGRLLPDFESNISTLGKGDEFVFTLSAESAYGERREDMIINIPASVFEKDGKIDDSICQIGNVVPMADADGNSITGIICEIGESFIRMDFNHPMAGIGLHFTGKIMDVRNATLDELYSSNACAGCRSSSPDGCIGTCS